jgi:predicted N-formylglutamate amidohydrolase
MRFAVIGADIVRAGRSFDYSVVWRPHDGKTVISSGARVSDLGYGRPAMQSIPDVVDVEVIRGARASVDQLDLVIEIPHGATRTAEYTRYAEQLTSKLPPNLVDFFHVNTDSGAPELGIAVARRLVADLPNRAVAVLRCQIPRTFIDCNRRIEAVKKTGMTPGLMPWITSVEDEALLHRAYDGYVGAVAAAKTRLGPDGAMLMLHTYAPRTVPVEVDAQIVEHLRAAYEPQAQAKFPMRPELDVIGRALDGTNHAPAPVVEVLRRELAGMTVADSASYPMHPSTLAFEHVMAMPGRTLCLEVRRDLLAEPFVPFAQAQISAAAVERLTGPLATALRAFW